MPVGSIFLYNRSQAVSLPVEARFPDNVKKVQVRVVGSDRILSPMDKSWDSFFLDSEGVTDDFMVERACQERSAREDFE